MSEVPRPATPLRSHVVDGVELSYAVHGQGCESVVLVNGLADAQDAWDNQVSALVEAGFRVVTFDNRGVGGSGTPAGPWTIEMMAVDLAGLLSHLDLGPVHLVGVSMGGLIAQRFALTRPADLRSLTLVSTFSRVGPQLGAVLRLWREAASALGTGFVLRDAATRCFTPAFIEAADGRYAELVAALAATPVTLEGFSAQVAALEAGDTTGELPGLRVPTLVVAAEHDQLVPPHCSRSIADAVQGASFRVIPGGHMAFWEEADALNFVLEAFMRAEGGGGGRGAAAG